MSSLDLIVKTPHYGKKKVMTLQGYLHSLCASSHGLTGMACHRTDCRCILEMFCSCPKLTNFRRAEYWQRRAPAFISSMRVGYLSVFAFRVWKKNTNQFETHTVSKQSVQLASCSKRLAWQYSVPCPFLTL